MMARPSYPKSNTDQPTYLLIGEILRPHGVHGEMRMRVLTDYPERIPTLESVYIGKSIASSDIRTASVIKMRMHQGYALLTLSGIDSRDEAERLRGLLVMVAIEDAIPLDDEEVYLFQLIGLSIRTQDGQQVGNIADVLETGANDVYVIDSPQHGELLIPATNQTIIETNIEDGYIVVDIPDGILPK